MLDLSDVQRGRIDGSRPAGASVTETTQPLTVSRVRKCLQKQNIYDRAAIPQPVVTDVKVKRRLQWCHTPKTCSMHKWKKVILYDESSSTLFRTFGVHLRNRMIGIASLNLTSIEVNLSQNEQPCRGFLLDHRNPERITGENCQVIYSQFGQNDHQARRRFVEWAQNEIAVVPDFHKRILFSDEAHFWLNGYVNKQNCCIWSEANPQVYVETPLHPEKLTVWCALWAGGIIGPYFFKNDEGHNVTVNGDRYRAMITNFFIPELNNHDVQELWFQQDGATCHTARATIDLLKDTLGDRLISRFGPVNWPPRSCDLTPLDYFLWGYVKSLVYADKPQTLDHLEDNIHGVIADIRPQMLGKVIENWTSRLDYIRASRGSPMPEIIFKM
ncbi:uncharacterized protein TNCV_449841 [Trichonephila clavipes]|nr:uncharacterized protein TNCV_449841 [Trichonephila clavipes]